MDSHKHILAAFLIMVGAACAQSTTGWQIVTMQDGVDGLYTNGAKFGKAVEYSVLTWPSADLANKTVQMFGTEHILDEAGVAINSGATDTFTAYNSHIVLDVTTFTTTGTVSVGGQRVFEDTGNLSNWVENITVDNTGCYQTSAKFLGACSNYTADADIVANVFRTSYFDFQNRDFIVSNVRMGWKPSSPTWNVQAEVYLIDNNGLTNPLVNGNLDFASSDTPVRAANGVIGHAKANVNSRLILGSQNEGIVVRIVGDSSGKPANITEFDLTIGCELK